MYDFLIGIGFGSGVTYFCMNYFFQQYKKGIAQKIEDFKKKNKQHEMHLDERFQYFENQNEKLLKEIYELREEANRMINEK